MNVTKEEILNIIDNVGVSANLSKIEQGASFKESGIDSLEMMNVFLGIEETYGIKIPDKDVDGLNTMNDIIDYLNNL